MENEESRLQLLELAAMVQERIELYGRIQTVERREAVVLKQIERIYKELQRIVSSS